MTRKNLFFIVLIPLCVILLIGTKIYFDSLSVKWNSPVAPGEEIFFIGPWSAQRTMGYDGLGLVSMDLLAEGICSMRYGAMTPCESMQEMIQRLRQNGSELASQTLQQPSLMVEKIDTQWNEGSGTSLVIYFIDKAGNRYYIGGNEFKKAVERGFITSRK